jgi:tRNA modification GTPase
VGIVRLSGPEALRLARAVAPALPAAPPPRTALRSPFVRAGAAFDEGLVLFFPAPRSYTGEEVVELHGHGGLATQTLLAAVLEAGARPAEPGEFTQRAFLQGQLDLVQAEAVALLIAAQSERALRAARAALGGSLSSRIAALQQALQALRGRVEGLLEFPAESEGAEAGLPEAARALAGEVHTLARTYARGRRLFTRARVVLAGPVNAGKSSLLNALVGEERALVDEEPGTTRDPVVAEHTVEGLPLQLVDTAGWRDASGVEARGIERGRAAAREADLVLWVTATAAPEPPPEPGWLGVASQRDRHPGPVPPGFLGVSAHTGEGLAELWREIARRLGGAPGEDEAVVARERQARGLTEAGEALERAAAHGPALELMAEELAGAAVALERVLGSAASGEVMDEVFRQFCIGK